jgi:hypothetical protein
LSDFVGKQPQQAELAGAFEQFMNGKVAAEDEIAAVMCPPRICGHQ